MIRPGARRNHTARTVPGVHLECCTRFTRGTTLLRAWSNRRRCGRRSLGPINQDSVQFPCPVHATTIRGATLLFFLFLSSTACDGQTTPCGQFEAAGSLVPCRQRPRPQKIGSFVGLAIRAVCPGAHQPYRGRKMSRVMERGGVFLSDGKRPPIFVRI